MIEKIKRYFFEKAVRDTGFTKKSGLNAAKKIAFIAQDTADGQIDAINRYINRLRNRNKEVFALVFSNEKMKNANDRIPYYIYKSDVSWYGKPDHETLEDFIKREYDILFFLDDASLLPMEYLLRMTKAHLKISPFYRGIERFIDISVDCKNLDRAGQLEEIDKVLDKLTNR